MVTYGSLAAQIELEAARAATLAPLPLPFPTDLLLGLGHIVADGDEWADLIDLPAADAA